MGGITGGGVSGDISGLQGLAPGFESLSGQAAALTPQFQNISNTLLGNAGQIYGPAYNQFAAGAAGQLTPAQQAAVSQTLNQMNLGTAGAYGNLGLGGSTMESQDLGANQLSSLAQQQAFEAQSEQLGLSALGEALGYYGGATNALTGETGALGTAGSILGGATQALGGAGQLGMAQQQQQLSALSNAVSALGGKSAGGGGLLGGLFG